uniref:Uncharacterized protein n=2 Tax=Anguilla anguilla TaxID=7936 RepID=A0A0E9S8T7_ANGAN
MSSQKSELSNETDRRVMKVKRSLRHGHMNTPLLSYRVWGGMWRAQKDGPESCRGMAALRFAESSFSCHCCDRFSYQALAVNRAWLVHVQIAYKCNILLYI